MVVVRDLPDAVAGIDRDRLRLELRHGRDAFVHRRREDDRLERRSRLTLRLSGEVELALTEVASTEHGLDGAVARVDRDESGRGTLRIAQNPFDRRPCLQLEVEVDRGRYLQPAAEDLARAVPRDELVLDEVHEVRRPSPGHAYVGGYGELRLVGTLELPLGDLALPEHHPEDVAPPRLGVARVARGVVERRVRRDPGEERRLGKVELLRALLEVRAGGLLDPVRAVPEVDRVQVGGENARLVVPALLELPRESGFSDLPCKRALVSDVGVLDELLRDGGAALDDCAVSNVSPEGARDALQIDAVVFEEALILDRDDRLPHDRRDVLGLDEDAALVAAKHGEHGSAVRRIDDRVHVRVLRGGVERGDLARDRAHETERERDACGKEEDEQQRRKTTLANPAPRTRRPLLSPNPQEG